MRPIVLSLALTFLIPACASPDPKPDDMSAAAHRAEAERDRQAARTSLERADDQQRAERAMVPGTDLERGPWTEDHPEVQKREGSPALEAAAAHSRHALAHERAAAELERFEEAECHGLPAETRAACPLLHDVVEIVDTYAGAKVVFDAGVSVPDVVVHVRCHLAFARAHGYENVEDCPLYVRGVQVAPAGDHALTLTAQDQTARELIRRIRQLAREEALPAAKKN